MHWGEEYLSGRGAAGQGSWGVNALTLPMFDPVSKQPELKHAAIKVLKAELPWRYVVFGWLEERRALSLQAALRPLMRRFAYASCTLFGRDRSGVLFRAADDYPAAPELMREIEAGFGLSGAAVLRYDDARRGNARRILVEEGALAAVALAGDMAAEHWLKDYLENAQAVGALGRLLLLPSSKAPQGFKARGRIVCNCLNVAETDIADALAQPGAITLEDLQRRLKCGTSCGSCVPELKQMVAMRAMRA
jgi:assimilatory nitrate reductase catalytic subunit